ncbi:M57 family metalloprotease [Chryseobacterium sp. SL1]|uniref:M57 family metalloprotease n=1 Tax=Chryseobacterium sp. SL1 TaxID=2995159 RepID=UPI002275AD4B|nr:M57 family metalloprotease [Chryseobacterium sp. SL1]MCY1660132.1 M57 family metalloprotease [Chryseobacterium sp. SL1]
MKNNNFGQQVLQGSSGNEPVHSDHTKNGQNFIINHKTKLFMKTTALFTLMAIIILGFLMTGCQPDDNIQQNSQQEPAKNQYDARVYKLSDDPQVQAELQFMKDQLGYDLSNVRIIKIGPWKGDYAQKEGWDVVVEPRENIQSLMKDFQQNGSGDIQARHRRNKIMATAGAKNIRYITSPVGSVPTAWKTAVNSAREKWNDLGKSLTFNVPATGSYSSSNTVNVSYQSLSAYLGPEYMSSTAAGRVPVSGQSVGSELVINSDMDLAQNLSTGQKTFVLAHELGHNIGFKHTNTSDGYQQVITGNPVCDNASDNQSVLRPGENPVPSWSKFSLCDQLAFDVFY